MTRPHLYLFDLDGTLIESYMLAPDPQATFHEVKPLPHRVEKIWELLAGNDDVRIAIVTNQAGVAFGHADERRVWDKLAHFLVMFDLWRMAKATSTTIRVYVCFAHPQSQNPRYQDARNRRKPEPGMLLDALHDFGIAPDDATMVGDMDSDKEAAARAGVAYVDAGDFFR
jgi:HAD superfamily hydrolase (TIGR01662 family)